MDKDDDGGGISVNSKSKSNLNLKTAVQEHSVSAVSAVVLGKPDLIGCARVKIDSRFHRWRDQRVHCSSPNAESTSLSVCKIRGLQGLLNAYPHTAECCLAASAGYNNGPMEYIGLTSDKLLRGPVSGHRHPCGLFMELFPAHTVAPLHKFLFRDSDDIAMERTPCPKADLGLTVHEQVHLLVCNVMHMALEVPDTEFSKARWLKPTRKTRSSSSSDVAMWTEVMEFDVAWLTSAPKSGQFARMPPTLQELQSGRPYRMTEETFIRALRHFPDLFSLCYHIMETYLASSDPQWFREMQLRHCGALNGDGSGSPPAEWAQRMSQDPKASKEELRIRERALRSEISSMGPKMRGANYMQISTRTSADGIYKTIRVETPFMIPNGPRDTEGKLYFQHAMHRPGQAPVLLLPRSELAKRNASSGTILEQMMTARMSVLGTTITRSHVRDCAARMHRKMVESGLSVSQKNKLLPPYLLCTPDFVRRFLCSVHLNSKPTTHSNLHQVSYCRWPRVDPSTTTAVDLYYLQPRVHDPSTWTAESIWRAINVDISHEERLLVVQETLNDSRRRSNGSSDALWAKDELVRISGMRLMTAPDGILFTRMCTLLRLGMKIDRSRIGLPASASDARALLQCFSLARRRISLSPTPIANDGSDKLVSSIAERVGRNAELSSVTSSLGLLSADCPEDVKLISGAVFDALASIYEAGEFSLRTDFEHGLRLIPSIVTATESAAGSSSSNKTPSEMLRELWTTGDGGSESTINAKLVVGRIYEFAVLPFLRALTSPVALTGISVAGVTGVNATTAYRSELILSNGNGFPVTRLLANCVTTTHRMFQQGDKCDEGRKLCMEQLEHIPCDLAKKDPALAAFVMGAIVTYIEHDPVSTIDFVHAKRKRKDDVAKLLDGGVGYAVVATINKLRKLNPTARCWSSASNGAGAGGGYDTTAVRDCVIRHVRVHAIDPERGFSIRGMASLVQKLLDAADGNFKTIDELAAILVSVVQECHDAECGPYDSSTSDCTLPELPSLPDIDHIWNKFTSTTATAAATPCGISVTDDGDDSNGDLMQCFYGWATSPQVSDTSLYSPLCRQMAHSCARIMEVATMPSAPAPAPDTSFTSSNGSMSKADRALLLLATEGKKATSVLLGH